MPSFFFIFRKYPRHKGACSWNKCKWFWGERIRQKEKRWQEYKLEFTGKFSGGRVAEWLECWTCNSKAQSSKSCPDRYLDLFSVVPSSNPQSRLWKYSQMVWLLPVRILNFVVLYWNYYLFHYPWKAPLGERIIIYVLLVVVNLGIKYLSN